jgi:hypothetical protein
MTPASSALAGREQDGAAHNGAAHDGGAQENPQDPRIPVWRALSELYLDTDVAALYPQIADALADSPYALDALHEMLMYDVHPALYPNLMIVAGEWAGFDDDWLLVRITQVRRQPRWRRRLSHLFVRSIREDWRAVAGMIVDLRAAATSAQATQAQTTQA